MKKSFSLFLFNLVAAATFASTAVVNFAGQTAEGEPCTLNKVLVENLTQGWSETITDDSLILEISSTEAIDNVLTDNDFAILNNGQDEATQVLFYTKMSGLVSVRVYDAAGYCVYHSTTTLPAGCHQLNLELATPQMYLLQISTPDKQFSHPILNIHTGGNSRAQFIESTVSPKMSARKLTSHTCNLGDNMQYTGYLTLNSEEYTDVKQGTIREGETNILFTFEVEANADYYIKHPWGSGEDDAWAWKPMKKESESRYTYSGLWGGVGVNINTQKLDGGATWISASSISGSAGLQNGDAVVFVYDAAKGKLTIESPSGSKYINASEAIKLAQAGDTGTYNIVGYVTYIRETYNSSFSNQSFRMKDEPMLSGAGGASFLAWRVKNSNLQETIEVGTKVMIQNAKLINYNNTTPETVAGAQFSIVEPFMGYYIKHPWGTGTDDAWQYESMVRIGTTSQYWRDGLWGGVGANIATFDLMFTEGGAAWFSEGQIEIIGNLELGDYVTFTYDANEKTLKVEEND